MDIQNKFEEVLILWASKKLNATEAAKQLAYTVELACYHKQPIVSKDGRYMEYLAALFRELAQREKN